MEWMSKAFNAGFNLVHAKLRPEYVAKFDVQKAWD